MPCARRPIVEQKSAGSDLGKAYDQAGEYFDTLPEREPMRFRADTGIVTRVEDGGRAGRRIYPFELKVVEQAGEGAALTQLRARKYADKYRALGEPIDLVGVEFSRDACNLATFETASA